MNKCALITGVGGQDGAYLAQLLLGKGYRVVGGDRGSEANHLWRLAELGIEGRVEYVPLDLLDPSNLEAALGNVRPAELYNLAAQSFVGASFESPVATSDVNALGALRLLEAVRQVDPKIRFFQASTSEMFGKAAAPMQSETTLFQPRSPYGVSKLFAHWMTVNYREAHGLFACSGILFNHESPLRGPEFVTRKISLGLAKIACGQQESIALGNLAAARDWGFAGDYVEAMWLMLQQSEPADYVLATGVTHTVEQFVQRTARAVGLELEWSGEGLERQARETSTGEVRVRVDPSFYRPAEAEPLRGDAAKARSGLGWRPRLSFDELVSTMASTDLARLDGSA